MSNPSAESDFTQNLSPDVLRTLQSYNACDISDALTKLQVPGAGFLPNLIPISTASSEPTITIAPASTIQFIPKHATDNYPPGNIPKGAHWSDLTIPRTILVISQPEGQSCAVLGGINATRMKKLGALGAVVHGRVRDVRQLKEGGMTIWATSTSTIGTSFQSLPHALQVPLDIPVATNPRTSLIITPGDIVFADSVNGVVVIPRGELERVLRILPALVEADARCLRAVEEDNMPVAEAFDMFRG